MFSDATLDTMSSTRGQRKRTLDTLSSHTVGGDPATRRRILNAALDLIIRQGAPMSAWLTSPERRTYPVRRSICTLPIGPLYSWH